MMKIIFYLLPLIVAVLGIPATAQPLAEPPQNQEMRPQDREITYPVRFARGKHSAIIDKTIELGTAHTYKLRAKEGQRMQVALYNTGKDISFTVHAPSQGVIEDADGVKDWKGDLPESGEYLITVGTDSTQSYTLEIAIK